MHKIRLRFRKFGLAIYLSHLDLMRTFQRAITRAGLNVKHSEGFNPHPYLSIALPLSLGYLSECEFVELIFLDDLPFQEIIDRLNLALPQGIEITGAYFAERPVKEISSAEYKLRLNYDKGVNSEAVDKITELFSNPPVVILKKSKRGVTEADITEYIKSIKVENTVQQEGSAGIIEIDTIISAGNTSLNPEYVVAAIKKYLPDFSPDFVEIKRIEVFGENMQIFK